MIVCLSKRIRSVFLN